MRKATGNIIKVIRIHKELLMKIDKEAAKKGIKRGTCLSNALQEQSENLLGRVGDWPLHCEVYYTTHGRNVEVSQTVSITISGDTWKTIKEIVELSGYNFTQVYSTLVCMHFENQHEQ